MARFFGPPCSLTRDKDALDHTLTPIFSVDIKPLHFFPGQTNYIQVLFCGINTVFLSRPDFCFSSQYMACFCSLPSYVPKMYASDLSPLSVTLMSVLFALMLL